MGCVSLKKFEEMLYTAVKVIEQNLNFKISSWACSCFLK